VSKISAHGKGGELWVRQDSSRKEVASEYNTIPDYTYLGYYQAQEQLVLEIRPNYSPSPSEIVSTNPERTRIQQWGENTFRFYFEDWNDADYNDLILEVKRGHCDSQEEPAESDQRAMLPAAESHRFTTREEMGMMYYAEDQVESSATEESSSQSSTSSDEDAQELEGVVAIQFLDAQKQVEELSIRPKDGGLFACDGSNESDNYPLPEEACQVRESLPNTQDLQKQLRQQQWYAWNGHPYWRTRDTSEEKLYRNHYRVMDASGNVTTISQSLVKDTAPPELTAELSEVELSSSPADSKGGRPSFQPTAQVSVDLQDKGLRRAAHNSDLSPRLTDSERLAWRYQVEGQEFTPWQQLESTQGTATTQVSVELNQLTATQLQQLREKGKLDLSIRVQAKDHLGHLTDSQPDTEAAEATRIKTTYTLSQPTASLSWQARDSRSLKTEEIQQIRSQNQDQFVSQELETEPIDVAYQAEVEYQWKVESQFRVAKWRLAEDPSRFQESDKEAVDWQDVPTSQDEYYSYLEDIQAGSSTILVRSTATNREAFSDSVSNCKIRWVR
jgi:hypothetical protein